MPSSLAKVQKHVTKKKGSKINSLHENSRDAMRLRKASARDDRVSRLSKTKQRINGRWIDRVQFVKDNLPDTLHPMSVEEIQFIIQDFLARYDDEIAELKAERRPGRPASTRQSLLEQAADLDRKEHESGFWIPNLTDEESLAKLDTWLGDWSNLAIMRFIRVDSAGRVKDSQFPPRGAS